MSAQNSQHGSGFGVPLTDRPVPRPTGNPPAIGPVRDAIDMSFFSQLGDPAKCPGNLPQCLFRPARGKDLPLVPMAILPVGAIRDAFDSTFRPRAKPATLATLLEAPNPNYSIPRPTDDLRAIRAERDTTRFPWLSRQHEDLGTGFAIPETNRIRPHTRRQSIVRPG